MRIYVMIIFVTLLSMGQTQNTMASPTSEAFVNEGRILLFDSTSSIPKMTYSGLLAANEKFKSAVGDDATDQEANLFYAITRVLVFYIKQGETAEIDTGRELLEAFGFTRNSEDDIESFPYNDLPELYDTYVPPDTTPSGEDLRSFLAEDFVQLFDAAIVNLNAITDNLFEVILTSAETADLPVEIDYGDVLFLKSLLYTMKASIQIVTAYDMDINLHDTIILANAGVLQFQRDLLDKYATFLSLRSSDGANQMSSAKDTLESAINTYGEALTSITGEIDVQDDDFISFGSDEEVTEAKTVLNGLNEFLNSLSQNRPYTEKEERWVLTDSFGNEIELSIKKDNTDKFLRGSFDGIYPCSFLSCDGWVSGFSDSGGNVTIEVGFGGFCAGSATMTGTIIGNQILGGVFQATDCSHQWDDSFTGVLQNSETEGFLDLNYLFGNTGKNPLDIRGILPSYDKDGDAIAGSFPYPYLNNLFPDITTEMALINAFDIPVVHDVPSASITVGGNSGDWAGVGAVAEDDEDADMGAPAGSDVQSLFVARDNDSFYWMMSLYDPPASNNAGYNFVASGESTDKTIYSEISLGEYSLYSYDKIGNYEFISDDPNDIGIGNVVEARIPLEEFDGTIKISVDSWTLADYLDNVTLRLPNSANINGTVTCNAFSGTGKIFIWAADGPDPFTSRHLSNVVIEDSPFSYTIPDLPIGKTVYLFARWDADNNGLRTFGDYVWESGPVEVLSNGTVKDIDITTEIDDSFILTKPGLYRIFGSNTYTIPAPYYGPWNPNEIVWGSGWDFIGEGNDTSVFNTLKYYKTILIVWHDDVMFYFDSIEDLTAGTAFATNSDGSPSGYSWVSSNLKNADTELWVEPDYFKGYPDGRYARSVDWFGFSLFSMPDDTVGLNTSRQLKLTVLHDLLISHQHSSDTDKTVFFSCYQKNNGVFEDWDCGSNWIFGGPGQVVGGNGSNVTVFQYDDVNSYEATLSWVDPVSGTTLSYTGMVSPQIVETPLPAADFACTVDGRSTVSLSITSPVDFVGLTVFWGDRIRSEYSGTLPVTIDHTYTRTGRDYHIRVKTVNSIGDEFNYTFMADEDLTISIP
ncbi:hypothetical protein KAR91_85790 [Candidatus Pacearchaeota archaeon]|nr:hypothetical protein [Candidatus Pacearchaeota archaeon]